ncbi:MAG TPA: class I SAM-dependent methyltransferase [Anaerolineaceae bacterium]|nr:class I SAM-dependent methyltransferase [Anaerolineaceae bacterium]HOA21154.1 class I SAM-dependent methyltransferase [Anaerolineaceae bacterium]HOG76935.1 class I SAM-dependent methyltransferase [Anaerolineaceae bacterium]
MLRELSSQQLDDICWKHLSTLPYFRGMLRAVEHSLYARFELPTPILDIGAGDGNFAEALGTGPASVGIDPWFAPMHEAANLGIYWLLVQAQGSALPVRKDGFPCAISNSVLEHIPDVQPVLDEISRTLTKDGVFLFAVPNQRFKSDLWGSLVLRKLGLREAAMGYSKFFNRIARHHNLDTPEHWMERLARAGFQKVEYWNYFPVKAMRMLERGHLAGLPNLLWKKLFGKWVLFPDIRNPFLRVKRMRKLLTDPFCDEGTCTFFVARKN